MTNFTLVGFLDTFELAASLVGRMNLFRPTSNDDGERVFNIRWNDGAAWKRTSLWTKWVELRNVVSRIQRQGSAMAGPIDLGQVFFSLLPPGVTLPWRTEDSEYWRLHLPVRTNPAAMMYAGVEMSHLLPGTLTLVNVRAGWSARNSGEWSRVHLVVDVRRRPGVFRGVSEIGPLVPNVETDA